MCRPALPQVQERAGHAVDPSVMRKGYQVTERSLRYCEAIHPRQIGEAGGEEKLLYGLI